MSFKDFSSKQKPKPEDKAEKKTAEAPVGTGKSGGSGKETKPAG